MAEIKDIRHEADKKDGSYADIARKMGRVPGTEWKGGSSQVPCLQLLLSLPS